MPTFMAPSSIFKTQLVETHVTSMVMTMYLIIKYNDMGIHDIMYRVSKKLVDIVKPMVHDDVQGVRGFTSQLW